MRVSVLLCFVLAGCTSAWTVSERAFVLCSGYASALESLAPLKGSLSAGTIERVDAIRGKLNPACSTSIQTHQSLDKVEGGLRDLLKIKDAADD